MNLFTRKISRKFDYERRYINYYSFNDHIERPSSSEMKDWHFRHPLYDITFLVPNLLTETLQTSLIIVTADALTQKIDKKVRRRWHPL